MSADGASKEDLLRRLDRTEGQMAGIRRLVARDQSRTDVLGDAFDAIARLVGS